MFEPKIIASNIKRHRMVNRLTQSKLAELLNVSVQAVSKWECGVALPDLPKLYMLAELFAVSVDELLGKTREEKAKKMMIGVAGGGFGTEFLLFDDAGTILGRKVLAASNPNYYGMEKCCEILKMGIDTLAGIFTQISGIFIGLAGGEAGDNNGRITEFLMKTYPNTKVVVRSNIQNIVASFPELKKAMFVICDTSALVCAKEDNKVRRFSGWGYRLEPSGSVLAIGRDALTAVLMAERGVGEHTLITEYVTDYFGKPLEQCLTHVYREDVNALVNFAPFVFEAYRRGDKVAEKILEKNMGYIAHLIQRAEEQCDCDNTVVLSSYLQSYEDSMVEILERKGLKGHRFLVPEFSQIYGACIRCAEMCGVEQELFQESFKLNYREFIEAMKQ